MVSAQLSGLDLWLELFEVYVFGTTPEQRCSQLLLSQHIFNMAFKDQNIWGRRTFCLITGASQGIGRVIASQFACKVADNSHFLLTARNSANLEETSSIIKANAPTINVTWISLDLEKATDLDLETIFIDSKFNDNVDSNEFEVAMIVHNAGSVGNIVQKSSEIENCEEMTSYFHLNLISMVCLNTKFLKKFQKDSVLKVIINITSLAAKVPFNCWSFYCSGTYNNIDCISYSTCYIKDLLKLNHI